MINSKLTSSITLRGHEIIQQSRALIEAQGLQFLGTRFADVAGQQVTLFD